MMKSKIILGLVAFLFFCHSNASDQTEKEAMKVDKEVVFVNDDTGAEQSSVYVPGKIYRGSVSWYFEHKGYGIIDIENGDTAFFQKKNINTSSKGKIESGSMVFFEIVVSGKGLVAKNISTAK
ncbi:cold-shock protein [Teredinibacter turnerae]|uniref:cold-shock protein n=1 Tax=Teredinibacter turnerae TaxID=2426 RepID=UPI0004136C7A|nr:cold shock domain-containing protein [Teredinibacter turnerae]